MAVDKVFRCDLCGELVAKDKLITVRVGRRDWRPEDYETVDVGPCCQSRPVTFIDDHARKAAEGMVR